jgi:hypothetical protein
MCLHCMIYKIMIKVFGQDYAKTQDVETNHQERFNTISHTQVIFNFLLINL